MAFMTLSDPDDRLQAVLFHGRERRKSLAGVPEMFRTHFLGDIPTATIDAARFPVRTTLITFWTSIRIDAVDPTGLVFEFGDSTTGIAGWIDNATVNLRAGDAAAADRGLATFTNGSGDLPVGLELDLVFAVRPGDGRVRIWGNGQEIARDTATNGQLTNGWAASSDGAFAAAVNGTTPADVTQSGAPANFTVIQPLSVYVSQVPRHFV